MEQDEPQTEAPPTPVLVGDAAERMLHQIGFPEGFRRTMLFARIGLGAATFVQIPLMFLAFYQATRTPGASSSSAVLMLVVLLPLVGLYITTFRSVTGAWGIYRRMLAAAEETRAERGDAPPPDAALSRETAARLLRAGAAPSWYGPDSSRARRYALACALFNVIGFTPNVLRHLLAGGSQFVEGVVFLLWGLFICSASFAAVSCLGAMGRALEKLDDTARRQG